MNELSISLVDLIGWAFAFFSLILSIWLYHKSEIRKRDNDVYKKSLEEFAKTIHDVSFRTMLSVKNFPSDINGIYKQRDSLASCLESIQSISANKVPEKILIGEYVYGDSLSKMEISNHVTDIWLFSHDLKPDIEEDEVLAIVAKNISKGKIYHYIYPSDFPKPEVEKFLNAVRSRIPNSRRSNANNLLMVPLLRESNIDLFSRGNIAIYEFKHDKNVVSAEGYIEIVLPSKRRGSLWERQAESITNSILYQFKNIRGLNQSIDIKRKFNDLTIEKSLIIKVASNQNEIESLENVRRTVFIDEQGVTPEEEFDDVDKVATHLIAISGGTVIGTLRFVEMKNLVQIGRVAVNLEFRGRGIGKALMENSMSIIKHQYPRHDIFLESQLEKIGFYEKFGFVAEGGVFMDARIPHRRMLLLADGRC